MRLRACLLILVAAPALALGACGASNANNCDPTAIAVGKRCFWHKEQACDEIGCLPPAQCVLVGGKPDTVVCNKP